MCIKKVSDTYIGIMKKTFLSSDVKINLTHIIGCWQLFIIYTYSYFSPLELYLYNTIYIIRTRKRFDTRLI